MNLRRLRQSSKIRSLVREVQVNPQNLIQPLFVVEGLKEREMIPGLTGTFRDTNSTIIKQIEADLERGVNSFLLFGVPQDRKEKDFSFDYVSKSIGEIKKRFGNDLFLFVDVCLCSSTTHGHCGILNSEHDHVLNSQTVNELAKAALTYAQAGADAVAPSDMMDGRIRAIRSILDSNGLERTLLMSYAAKFHSSFYGPFRVAADSAPKGELKLKDRATYQIDPANRTDALASARRDAEEGADILMVKPGLPYLDILQTLSQEIAKPWAVYEVSGEYAAIELMAEKGLMNREKAHVEAWTALFRAGAQMVISYGAREAKAMLKKVEW